PPLRESLKKSKLKKQDVSITKPKANLLCFTDFIGKKIQYDCQHRMAGLAALEKRINMLSQNRGGAGCSTSTSSETSTGYASLEDRSSG
ncbi:unnamed protein product, partial [Brassica rapa subsp. narinosa]